MIADLRKEITKLLETVSEQKDNIVTKENEVLVLQDCLKHLKTLDDEEGHDKLDALLDVGHIKAELKILTIERDTLAEKLQGEEDARKLLEGKLFIYIISYPVTQGIIKGCLRSILKDIQ